MHISRYLGSDMTHMYTVHSNLCIETKATASVRTRTLPLPTLTLVALGEDVVEQILSVSSKHLKCEQND